MTTEHCKLKVCPAVTVTGVEGEMETGPMSTVRMEINDANHTSYCCYSQMLT